MCRVCLDFAVEWELLKKYLVMEGQHQLPRNCAIRWPKKGYKSGTNSDQSTRKTDISFLSVDKGATKKQLNYMQWVTSITMEEPPQNTKEKSQKVTFLKTKELKWNTGKFIWIYGGFFVWYNNVKSFCFCLSFLNITYKSWKVFETVYMV